METRPAVGQRICVVGTSGSGKTYVAEALARRLGLRYVSNDALQWRANWELVPDDERVPAFDEATRDGDWAFDGNLWGSEADRLVLSRCDTLVWLDFPRWRVMSAIIARTFRRAWTRAPTQHGNVEGWRRVFSRESMILWAWQTHALRRRQYGAMFADPAHAGRARIRLASRTEVNRWLEGIGS